MDGFDLLAIIKQVGPLFALIIFFVWRDFRREQRLETKLDELNIFVRDRLMQALERNNEILTQWKTPTSSGR